MRLKYNAPVTLSFALLSAAILLTSQLTGGMFISNWFTTWPDFRVGSLASWVRLFGHPIGHASWAHLVSNFSFILLIGPVLEEKYGSLRLLAMMLITAAATGFASLLLVRAGLLGASGIAFMLILLSSFTNIRSGELPLTFLLVVVLYLVREFVAALTPDTVSQLAHIVGGTVGAIFGFAFARREPAPASTGPTTPLPNGGSHDQPQSSRRPARPRAGGDRPGDR